MVAQVIDGLKQRLDGAFAILAEVIDERSGNDRRFAAQQRAAALKLAAMVEMVAIFPEGFTPETQGEIAACVTDLCGPIERRRALLLGPGMALGKWHNRADEAQFQLAGERIVAASDAVDVAIEQMSDEPVPPEVALDRLNNAVQVLQLVWRPSVMTSINSIGAGATLSVDNLHASMQTVKDGLSDQFPSIRAWLDYGMHAVNNTYRMIDVGQTTPFNPADDMNGVNPDGLSPLSVALASGDDAALQLILEHPAFNRKHPNNRFDKEALGYLESTLDEAAQGGHAVKTTWLGYNEKMNRAEFNGDTMSIGFDTSAFDAVTPSISDRTRPDVK